MNENNLQLIEITSLTLVWIKTNKPSKFDQAGLKNYTPIISFATSNDVQ